MNNLKSITAGRARLRRALIVSALFAFAFALFASFARPLHAQTPFLRDGLTGEPYTPTIKVITNALAGVGGLHTTNTLTQLTNGSTTVTSAWVRLGGRGATLWLQLGLTNALLTNIVTEWRFSRDGTNANAGTEPIFLWRTATAAHAVGNYVAATNLPSTYVGEMGFIQLWKVHLTNGVNNVGSAFGTNNQAFFLQRGS